MFADFEQCFRRLHGVNILGIVTADEQNITSANGEFLRMIGRTRADLKAGLIKWQKLTPPDYAALDARNLRRLKQRACFPPCEKELLRKDGGRVPVLLEGSLITRKPLRFVCFVQDLTARKQAAIALRASEERYRLLAENAADLVSLHDDQGKCLYRSPSFYRVTGWSESELDPATARQRVHPADWPAAKAAWDACLRGERRVVENRYRCKDGTWLWLETRWQPVLGPDRRVEHFIITSHDITERKRTEEAARTNARRLEVLVQTAPAAIVIHGADGKLLRCNAVAEQLLGISRRRAAGKDLKDRSWHFLREDGTPMPAAEYPVALVLKQQAPLANYICGIQHAGKKTVWVLVHAQPRFSGDGALADVTVAFIDITKRKQAEEALRESEARFRQLADMAPLGVWVRNLKGKSEYVGPWFLDYLGMTKPLHLDAGRGQVIHPDDLPRVQAAWKKAKATGSLYQVEVRLRDRNGQYRWFLSRAVPLKDEHGAPQRWLGTSTDIHDQKLAEQVLAESEARFRQLVESVPVPAWTAEPGGEGGFCNRRWCEYTGQTPEQFTGFGWLQAVHPEDIGPTQKQIMVAIRRHRLFEAEYRLRRRDGVYRWHLSRGYAARNESDKITGWFGTTTDIHDQKMAQQELERLVAERTGALRESEEKFRRLFGTVADAVLLFDAKTRRILEVNEAMLRMYGCSREQALRLTAVELSAQPEAAGEALQRVVAGLSEPNLRALHRKRDGTVFPVQISASTFEFQGRPLVCLVVRDITRELEMEKEILAISEREQQRIARDVHDDLCQHLTGIQFLAASLAADLKDLTRPESAGARRIAGLTRQALQKARGLSHGLAPVELEHGGLAVALRRLCLQVQPMFRCRCHLHCDPQVVLPPPATAIHLYRIVQEAVSNAVRHGRASRIDITIAARRRGWTLKIADNGLGLGKAKNTGAAKPGMGLRVMQYRAGIIGGTLSVRSRPRTGAEVVCILPDGPLPLAPRKD